MSPIICFPKKDSIGSLRRILAGEARNREPEKTRDVRWFPRDQLPLNLTTTARNAIQAYGRQTRRAPSGRAG